MIGWRGQWEEGAGTPEPPEMQITKKLWEKMTKNSEDKYYKNKSVGRGGGDTRASEDADRDSEDKYSAKTNLGKNANKILKKQNYKKNQWEEGAGTPEPPKMQIPTLKG